MDPFEEFEFKPLTEGLGFHKKAEKPAAKAEAQPSQAQQTQKSQSISELIASLPPAMDFLDQSGPEEQAKPQITQPVGRKDYIAPEPVDIKNRTAAATAMPPLPQRAGLAPTPTLKSPLNPPAANDISRSFPHLDRQSRDGQANKIIKLRPQLFAHRRLRCLRQVKSYVKFPRALLRQFSME